MTDLDEAIAFYKRVLRLELIWDARDHCNHDEMLHVEMCLPCAGARLLIESEPTTAKDHASSQLLLMVQHASAVRDRLVAKGATVRPAVADDVPSHKCGTDEYGYTFFVMRDPFGNEILFGGHD